MKVKEWAPAGLILVILSGVSCGGRQAVELDPNSPMLASRWNGTVATPPELSGVVEIRGSGWMAPENSEKTRAHMEIRNAVPGAVHPWHIHRGQCGSDQGIFGPADAYNPVEVGGNGQARSDATLPVPMPKTGDFFLNVHASAKNMGTIVACGNLAPPAR